MIYICCYNEGVYIMSNSVNHLIIVLPHEQVHLTQANLIVYFGITPVGHIFDKNRLRPSSFINYVMNLFRLILILPFGYGDIFWNFYDASGLDYFHIFINDGFGCSCDFG
uniref:Uncharacterized protein n=1 Tax=Cacopsylla melanoneura TaxID=428564 RepID=A0A8D9B2F3_9HEMI